MEQKTPVIVEVNWVCKKCGTRRPPSREMPDPEGCTNPPKSNHFWQIEAGWMCGNCDSTHTSVIELPDIAGCVHGEYHKWEVIQAESALGRKKKARVTAVVNWVCRKKCGTPGKTNNTKTPPPKDGCTSTNPITTHDWAIGTAIWTCLKCNQDETVFGSEEPPKPGTCPKGGGHEWN
jgi:hypothetical protein